jgi:hypothetical protein
MSERWRRELTKLRQAPELPDNLWGRVRTGPRMQGARISRPTRAMTIAVALAVAIPALALAWIAMQPFGEDGARAGLGVLDVPPLGQVAPANLADGRPVFVVHQDDGTVEVIDGYSTHVPWGLAKLVAWCSTSRTFDDVFHGARWSESGTYISGPAPTGLATYQSTIQPDGRLLVGSRIPPASRPSPGGEVQSDGPFCMTSANLEYPTMPTNVSDSPADVVASAPDGWVAVRGSLNRGSSTGAELCTFLARGNAECAHGAPVEGIDVHGLFDRDPGAVVSGTFITRVENGSLVDLTRVPEPEIDGQQTR